MTWFTKDVTPKRFPDDTSISETVIAFHMIDEIHCMATYSFHSKVWNFHLEHTSQVGASNRWKDTFIWCYPPFPFFSHHNIHMK